MPFLLQIIVAITTPLVASSSFYCSLSSSCSSCLCSFVIHKSFAEIAKQYDGFILDQFGVLHNGANALEGAPECVDELRKQNKKLIILSNTSGPASSAMAKLPKFGYHADQFIGGAITSGEEASKFIKATYGSGSEVKRALWFTWDGGSNSPSNPQDFMKQCSGSSNISGSSRSTTATGTVVPSCSIDDADFVLAHGSDVWQQQDGTQIPLTNFKSQGDLQTVVKPILRQCLARDLPLICANPDFVVRMPDGSMGYMPGNIAQCYKEMGGKCTIFGKPNKEHFEACIKELGMSDRSRIVHVGDSIHHDIAGANAAGIDSVFVTSGIHCEELQQSKFGVVPKRDTLQAFFERENQFPTHVVSAFQL